MKPKLIPAIGGGKEDPPELLWRVLLFNAITPQEIANAEAYRIAHPDEEAAPTDDVETLLRTPPPAAFLGGAWDEDLHPRGEHGKFGTKDGGGTDTLTKSDPAAKASELARLATQTDYGDADEENGWGETTDVEAWQAAHEEAVALVGDDVTYAIEQWSSAVGITDLRDAYTEYRASGDTATNSNAEEFSPEFADEIHSTERGAQDFFEMMDASRVDAPLYRGFVEYRGDESELKVGDPIPDGISSWTRDPAVARVFSDQGSPQLNYTVTRMEMEPGAHGVDITALGEQTFAWQEEVIVGGPMTITSVKVEQKDGDTIRTIGVKAAT